jgi:hypothetical protein
MFDMGESLKERKGDRFFVGKIVNREITFYQILSFFQSIHINLTFKYGNIKINVYLEWRSVSKSTVS